MKRLIRLEDDISIDQIFLEYKFQIFDNILETMKENYQSLDKEEIHILSIQSGSFNYSLNLTKDKFMAYLDRLEEYFLELEEYEKCQDCVNIREYLNNNNHLKKHSNLDGIRANKQNY